MTDTPATCPRTACWQRAALWAAFGVFLVAMYGSLFSTVAMNGESSVLSNVVIEFVRTGLWHYPLHAQHLFYPGVEKFMIHPPLHYLFASLWVKLFGIGVWQLHMQSTVAGIVGISLGTWLTLRFFGIGAAILVPTLATILAGFYYSSLCLRPDISFGLMYFFTVCVFGRLLLAPLTRREELLYSFLFGALAVACLATHWFGYFVQFYPAVYGLILLYRRRLAAIAPILACALGWASAMGVWYLAFGKDLLPSLIFILIKGNQFRSMLDIPLPSALVFIDTWYGGRWLLIGFLLGLTVWGVALYRRLRVHKAWPMRLRVLHFVVLNLIGYGLFFYFFVGNKSAQYAANILFIALPLAAVGFVSAIGWLLTFVKRPQYLFAGVCGLAVVMHVVSPVARAYVVDAWNGPQVGTLFNDTVRAFSYIVPKDRKILLGGNAYPYLYDSDYDSTMLFVARNVLKDPGHLPLREMIAYYQNMPGKDYGTHPFPIAARRAQLPGHDYIVTADNGHSWQWFFIDPHVWSPEYREIGMVTTIDNPRPHEPFFYGDNSFYAYSYLVYARKNAKAPDAFSKGSPRILMVGKYSAIVTSGAKDRNAFISGAAWKALDEQGKRAKLKAYFDYMEWYGATLSDDEKQAIVDSIYPLALSYITSWEGYKYNEVPFHRTLANAVDYAFQTNGYPKEFPRIAESEWHK